MPKPIPDDAVVYAVESGGLIKIGTTTRLDQRLKALARMGGSDLVLLGTIPGDHRQETALHREFAAWRHHGEWFQLPDAQRALLVDRLAGVPRLMTVPIVVPEKIVIQQRGPVWRMVNGKPRRVRFRKS